MSPSPNNNEVLLGLDYGLTNTGLALSIDGIVSPLKIVNSKNFNHFQAELSNLIFKNPLSHDGKENRQSIVVRQVVNNLKKYIKIPIIYINEYGTTQNSLSNGIVTNLSKKTRNKESDHYSAALILETYLDSLN